MGARLEETVDLPDGRRLGFAEVGDPSGVPLLYFHGNPGSRLDFAFDRHGWLEPVQWARPDTGSDDVMSRDAVVKLLRGRFPVGRGKG